MLKSILDIIFPKYCLICSKLGSTLCPYCKRKLILSIPECYKCRRLSPKYKTHECCIEEDSLISIFYAWQYNKKSSSLIKTFKYRGAYSIGIDIAELFTERILASGFLEQFSNPLLIPIPLHPRKQKKRGFNQTEILTEDISKILDIPFRKDLLFRPIYSESQAGKRMENRNELKKNTFKFKKEDIPFREIILVDDVITTGATLERAASAVREENKNIRIHAMTLFRGKPLYSSLDKSSIS